MVGCSLGGLLAKRKLKKLRVIDFIISSNWERKGWKTNNNNNCAEKQSYSNPFLSRQLNNFIVLVLLFSWRSRDDRLGRQVIGAPGNRARVS